MNPIRFFFPRRYEFKNNKFNKNISVIDYFPEPTLIVDGLIESGRVITEIWKKGVTSLVPRSASIKNVLILGLGAGSNTHLVSYLYPKAQITAVEIDSQVVDIGNKFFSLGKVKNLKIIVGDAVEFVDGLSREASAKWDLVLVDCFVGKNIPSKLQEMSFLEKLYNHSVHLLVNRIWYNQYHLETVFFLRKISQRFFVIKAHTTTNVILKLI